MSVRIILLVLGWMLVGLAFCPMQQTIVDSGSGGTRWTLGLPGSPLFVWERVHSAGDANSGESFHQGAQVQVLSGSGLCLLGGVLLISAANRLRRPRGLRASIR